MALIYHVPDAYDLTLEDFLRCLRATELSDEVVVNACDGAFDASFCDGMPETPGEGLGLGNTELLEFGLGAGPGGNTCGKPVVTQD